MSKNQEKPVDYLEPDEQIRGQNFVCLSFLSPEDVIRNKDSFFVQKFLDSYVAKLKIDSVESFLVDKLVPKLNENENVNIKPNDVLPLLEDYVKENTMSFREDNVNDEYQAYLSTNRSRLEELYVKEHGNQCSVRGLKVRGTYNTRHEAERKARNLQKFDPAHSVFVGQVGYWLPWDPNPQDIDDHEYSDTALNDLMKSYKENEMKKKEFFSKEKREAMEEALRANREVQNKEEPSIKFEQTKIPTSMFGEQNNISINTPNAPSTANNNVADAPAADAPADPAPTADTPADPAPAADTPADPAPAADAPTDNDNINA